jgi:hypothetical protein
MTLNHHPDYPSGRYYVLKLHRDADAATGRLQGRIEHVASGVHFDFVSTHAMVATLARHIADTDVPVAAAPGA